MSTLERAIAIAAEAHSGQLDKAGQPYILHPLKVMLRMHANDERIAAVLHDVVEDTAVGFSELRNAGFSEAILDAVDALTKREGESRMDAAIRAKRNPISRAVKLSDNAENLDISRIANPSEKDYARLAEYRAVREFLLSD
jgi:GTP diphosphokinase / guanosine-3',5'-bis(diphosphate) 3'-diphosphatase